MNKWVLALFFTFVCQGSVAVEQAVFLENKRGDYTQRWRTMADAEAFAIAGQRGQDGLGDNVNERLRGVLSRLVTESELDRAQAVAMLSCAGFLFEPYNPEANLICTSKMLEIAERKNFKLAILLLKSQSSDGASYDFSRGLSGSSYTVVEKAINILASEHNGHAEDADAVLEELKGNGSEVVKEILSVLQPHRKRVI